MKDRVYVTTSLKASEELRREAAGWAAAAGAVYVSRGGRSVTELQNAYKHILIYTDRGPEIHSEAGIHRFHLSMAELRIQHIREGDTDHFLEAVGARESISFLDCTCGFGADAAVASFWLDGASRIDAVEASPLLGRVTAWGFSRFRHERDDVNAALRRIRLHLGTYEDFLRRCAEKSYDVIYFDPMFSRPVVESCSFTPVRAVMEHGSLTYGILERALFVARRRVVIKGRDLHGIRRVYPQMKQYGGKYSRIAYAVLECDR